MPVGRNVVTMRALAKEIERFAVAGATEFMQNLVRNTTSGEGIAPGIPVRFGEARGSLRVTIGSPPRGRWEKRLFYPVIGANDVDRIMRRMRLGRSVFAGFLARHPPVLEGGRRRDSRGRMIGSEQAPEGFFWLARDQSIEQLRRWRYQGSGGLRIEVIS